MNFDSLCVHTAHQKLATKPQNLPIYATSSFAFDDVDQGMAIFTGEKSGHFYSRFSNPTVDAVQDKIAALETFGTGIEASAVMVSSGMAAISTLVLGVLKAGDKILTQQNLYGGTTQLFNEIIQPLDIEVIMTDLKNVSEVKRLMKKHAKKDGSGSAIKMIFIETPANPTLACVDIQALSDIAKQYNAYSTVDNTFCSPFLQQPFRFGVDFIIHSTTKYINGHGNSTAGIIVGRDKELMVKKVWQAMKLVGTNCSPFEAWLTNNGMKTLPLRMQKHCANAKTVAEFLQSTPSVSHVNYPGLKTHPDYKLAKKQMPNGSGGMVSFELAGGLEAGVKFMNKIKFCSLAPTMGDVDTLILHPASMSHLRVPREIRLANGITDGLIRLSVGIEDFADIIADLQQAMDLGN
jgi:methionine-gamma-lyase